MGFRVNFLLILKIKTNLRLFHTYFFVYNLRRIMTSSPMLVVPDKFYLTQISKFKEETI